MCSLACQAHPLADLIPAMSDEEYARLRDDIAANGLLDAITLYEELVLDGRHRLRACQETGIEPRFAEYEGDSPAQFVLSHNVARRHLSVSQRAMVATDFLPHLEAEARKRQGGSGRFGSVSDDTEPRKAGQPARAAADAGNAIGVSGVTVARAKRVREADPELAQSVRQGDLTVNTAVEIVKARANGEKVAKPETGHVSMRSVQRIASQASALAMAIQAVNLTKSCARLSDDERAESLQDCKTGLKALNALANALGR
jgi:hypothetical protein